MTADKHISSEFVSPARQRGDPASAGHYYGGAREVTPERPLGRTTHGNGEMRSEIPIVRRDFS